MSETDLSGPHSFFECFYLFLKELIIIFLFVVTAAGVVPCGIPQKRPRTSSLVQIIFKLRLVLCFFLGHEISKNGICPPSGRIELLRDFPTPTSRKELQRTLGLFNWFRKFFRNYSTTASPLYLLLKKGVLFKWSASYADTFQTLKTSLCNSQALAFPRFDLEFRQAVKV